MDNLLPTDAEATEIRRVREFEEQFPAATINISCDCGGILRWNNINIWYCNTCKISASYTEAVLFLRIAELELKIRVLLALCQHT